jgi:hypothetical protein
MREHRVSIRLEPTGLSGSPEVFAQIQWAIDALAFLPG